MASVTGSPATTPDSIVQRPRVPHTESPTRPSELLYRPVTPSLLSTGTVVECPLASVKTSGVVDGCSSERVTRMPRSPSFSSAKVTGWPSAVSVVIHPFRGHLEHPLTCSALGAAHRAMQDRAHLGRARRRNGIRVVPEVEAVYVAVGEPQADVMRVVHALARSGLERPAARHHGPRGRAQRVERRLLERGRVDVRREGLAVHEHVDPALVLVGHHVDTELQPLRV